MGRLCCFGGGGSAVQEDAGSAKPVDSVSGKYLGDGVPEDEFAERQAQEEEEQAEAPAPGTGRRVRLSMHGGVFEPGNFHKAPVNAIVLVRNAEAEKLEVLASLMKSTKAPDAPAWREATVTAVLPNGKCDVRFPDGTEQKDVHAKDVQPVDVEYCLEVLAGVWFDGHGSRWEVLNHHAARETTEAPDSVTLVHQLTRHEKTGMLSLGRNRLKALSKDVVAWMHGQVWRRSPNRALELTLPDPSLKFVESAKGVVLLADQPAEDLPGAEDDPDKAVLRSGAYIHAIGGTCVMTVEEVNSAIAGRKLSPASGAATTSPTVAGRRGRYVVRICAPPRPASAPKDNVPFDPKFITAGARCRCLWGGQWHAATVVACPGQHVEPAQSPPLAALPSPMTQLRKWEESHGRPTSPFAMGRAASPFLMSSEAPVAAAMSPTHLGGSSLGPGVTPKRRPKLRLSTSTSSNMSAALSQPSPRCAYLRRASHVTSPTGKGFPMPAAVVSPKVGMQQSPALSLTNAALVLSPMSQPMSEASAFYLLSPVGAAKTLFTVQFDFDAEVLWQAPAASLDAPEDDEALSDAAPSDGGSESKMEVSSSASSTPRSQPAGQALGSSKRWKVEEQWAGAMDIYATVLSNLGRREPGAGFTRGELLQELRLTHTQARAVLRRFEYRRRDSIALGDWMRWFSYLCENDWAESYVAWMRSQLRGVPPFLPPPTHAGRRRSGSAVPLVNTLLTEPGQGLVLSTTLVRKEPKERSDACGFMDSDTIVDVVEVGEEFARIAAPVVGWIPLVSEEGDVIVAEDSTSRLRDPNVLSIVHCRRQTLGLAFDPERRLADVAEGSPAERCGARRFLGRTLVAVDGAEVTAKTDVKKALRTPGPVAALEFKRAPRVQMEYRKQPHEGFQLVFEDTVSGRVVFKGVPTHDQNYPTFSMLIEEEATLQSIDGDVVRAAADVALKAVGTTAPIFEFTLPELGAAVSDDASEATTGSVRRSSLRSSSDDVSSLSAVFLARSANPAEPGVSHPLCMTSAELAVPPPPPVVLYDREKRLQRLNKVARAAALGPLSQQLAAETEAQRHGVQIRGPDHESALSDSTSSLTDSGDDAVPGLLPPPVRRQPRRRKTTTPTNRRRGARPASPTVP